VFGRCAFGHKDLAAPGRYPIRVQVTKDGYRLILSFAKSFGNFGSTLGGTLGNGREPQVILKTDQRTILLELGLGGKFLAKSSGWDENQIFLEGDVLEVAVRNGRWVLGTSRPDRARHRLRPSTIFRPRSDGVTGYVTSSHGAATPLRYDVTGHLAGNQPVRSRYR
jgi:hypothetical protein